MQHINNILADGLQEESQKPFWRYIKAQRTGTIGVAPLKEKGQVHSGPVKKASILAQQFRSVFTVDNVAAANTYLHGPSIPPPPDLDISEMGIKKLLKGVDPSKTSGPDQIPCQLLHELNEELAPVFTVLFTKFYNTGTLPEVWKSEWITPVFKKGSKSEAAIYRPVSLTCVACKLLERVVLPYSWSPGPKWCFVSQSAWIPQEAKL
jgi:hypothetical protein